MVLAGGRGHGDRYYSITSLEQGEFTYSLSGEAVPVVSERKFWMYFNNIEEKYIRSTASLFFLKILLNEEHA